MLVTHCIKSVPARRAVWRFGGGWVVLHRLVLVFTCCLLPSCAGGDTGDGDMQSSTAVGSRFIEGEVVVEDWPYYAATLSCAFAFQCCGEAEPRLGASEAECRDGLTSLVQFQLPPILESIAAGSARYRGERLTQCLESIEAAGCLATSEQLRCLEPEQWLEALRPVGELCQEHFECDGARCIGEDGDSPCQGCDGWCTPPLELDEYCDSDEQCESNYCKPFYPDDRDEDEEWRCAPPEPPPEPACEPHPGELKLPDAADSSACPSGSVSIANEVQLERLVGCTHITGDLIVRRSLLESTSGLESLTRIDGSLVIRQNEELRDLRGLEHLEFVGGYLELEANPVLVDLVGLSALEEVGRNLSVAAGPEMLAVELPSLERVGGHIDASGGDRATRLSMAALTQVGGLWVSGRALTELDFESLRVLQGSLSVSECEKLSDLEGFGALEQVFGSVMIQDTAGLTSTAGAERLREIGSELSVADNQSLVSLKFAALESIGGGGLDNPYVEGPNLAQLYVARNPALAEVSLPSLEFVGGEVRFYEHPELPQCQAEAVAMQVGQSCNCSDNGGTEGC